MFKSEENRTFTREVKFMLPVEGGFRPQSFSATFLIPPIEEFLELAVAGSAEDFRIRMLRRAIVDLSGILDDADKPQPYSEGLRDWLLDFPFIRFASMHAYVSGLSAIALQRIAARSH